MNGWRTATGNPSPPRGWRRSSRGPARACRGTTSFEPSDSLPDPGRPAAGTDGDGAGRDAQGRRTYRLRGGGVKAQEVCAWGRGTGGRGVAAVDRQSGREPAELHRFLVVFGARTWTLVPSMKPRSAVGPSSNGRLFGRPRKDFLIQSAMAGISADHQRACETKFPAGKSAGQLEYQASLG